MCRFNHCRPGFLVKQIQHVAVTRLRQNQQCRRPHRRVLIQHSSLHSMGTTSACSHLLASQVAGEALVNAHNVPGLAACLHTAAFTLFLVLLGACALLIAHLLMRVPCCAGQ